jgi:hypothetical protein
MYLGVHIIEEKKVRDLWYYSHTKKSLPGNYAYGVKQLKCMKTPWGYRIRDKYLPKEVPIYRYGYTSSTPLAHAHGAIIFRCQVPGGFHLPFHSDSVEEQIFPYSNRTVLRSTKNKLKVRCGKYYRIILLNLNIEDEHCYIFGTNIRVLAQRVPKWMRRKNVILPNPMKTSRKVVKSAGGMLFHIGQPQIGIVYIAGVQMHCSKIGQQLCTIIYKNKKFCAHPSVVFNYKQYSELSQQYSELSHSKSTDQIEEQIFPYSNRTVLRSTKNILKVRCGKYYRLVLINLKIEDEYCYIFGTNIRVLAQTIPKWMRRKNVILPNPMKTSRKAVKSAGGIVFHVGQPLVGTVYIAGIKMYCSDIGNHCTIMYKNKKFCAHASVTFNYKQYADLHK